MAVSEKWLGQFTEILNIGLHCANIMAALGVTAVLREWVNMPKEDKQEFFQCNLRESRS